MSSQATTRLDLDDLQEGDRVRLEYQSHEHAPETQTGRVTGITPAEHVARRDVQFATITTSDDQVFRVSAGGSVHDPRDRIALGCRARVVPLDENGNGNGGDA